MKLSQIKILNHHQTELLFSNSLILNHAIDWWLASSLTNNNWFLINQIVSHLVQLHSQCILISFRFSSNHIFLFFFWSCLLWFVMHGLLGDSAWLSWWFYALTSNPITFHAFHNMASCMRLENQHNNINVDDRPRRKVATFYRFWSTVFLLLAGAGNEVDDFFYYYRQATQLTRRALFSSFHSIKT